LKHCQLPLPKDVLALNQTLDTLVNVIDTKKQQAKKDQWIFSINGHVVPVREKVEKVLEWLNKFKQVGDIAVNANPLCAGLPWAGIRVLIEAASADKDALGRLLLSLDRVFNIVRRCTVYDELYFREKQDTQAYKNLEDAIIDLYAVVLKVLAIALRDYSRCTAGRAWHYFLNPDELASIEKELESSEDHVEKEAVNFDRTQSEKALHRRNTELQHLTDELSKLRDLPHILDGLHKQANVIFNTFDRTKQILDQLWIKNEVQERSKILLWTSDIPYEDHHTTARTGRVKDTCLWIQENHAFKEWRSTDQSTILWVHGIRKSG